MNQTSGGHRRSFTPKQGQYLAFIDAYARVNRRPPAEWEMQRHLGVTPPSVHQMILAFERAGFIRRQPGVPRSIEVLVPPEALPLLQAHIRPVKTSV
jgi:DNA-binding MarR family transcriptional regulator